MRSDTGQFKVRSRIATLVGYPIPQEGATQPGRASRFTAMLEVCFRSDMEFVHEHATNMSAGGVFAPTTQTPPVDSEVLLTVRLPNGDILQSPARVVQIVEQPRRGVGLSFAGYEPVFEAALQAYLLSLAGRRS